MNISICCYLCAVYANNATWINTNSATWVNTNRNISLIMNHMKKFFLGLAAALMLTACNENRQPEAMTSVDSANVVTDLMMSRRSIRAYKDSVISAIP